MSHVLDPQEQRRHVLFMGSPRLWPVWPFLPLIRRSKPMPEEECGLLCDLEKLFGLSGYRCTVWLTNLFLIPASLEEFVDLPKEMFDSPEEVFSAGWRID